MSESPSATPGALHALLPPESYALSLEPPGDSRNRSPNTFTLLWGRRSPPRGLLRPCKGRSGTLVTLAGMKILVTGGAGYIGSTTAKALEAAGHVPVVLDSLLTGPQAFVRDRIFYEGDIGDRDLIRRIVDEHPDLDATIHMAARIVVPESVEKPYEYYRDNVAKSLELFDQLEQLGKPRVVFSSSGSLYAIKEIGRAHV